jgi:hypothetical protein
MKLRIIKRGAIIPFGLCREEYAGFFLVKFPVFIWYGMFYDITTDVVVRGWKIYCILIKIRGGYMPTKSLEITIRDIINKDIYNEIRTTLP